MGQAIYQLNQLPPLLLLGLWPQDPAVTESNLQEQGAPRAIKRFQSPYARPVYIWVSPTLWQVGSAPPPFLCGFAPCSGLVLLAEILAAVAWVLRVPTTGVWGRKWQFGTCCVLTPVPLQGPFGGEEARMCQVMDSAQVAMTVRGRAWPELAVFSRAWPSLQPRQCRWQQPGLGATAM